MLSKFTLTAVRASRFRQLAHTADVRLAVYGSSEEELLRHLALGIQRLVFGFAPRGKPRHKAFVELPPGELISRLVRLGNEVVYWLFTRQHLTVDVHLQTDHAELALRPLPPHQQPLFEVKAVTFHDLQLSKKGNRWRAILTIDL